MVKPLARLREKAEPRTGAVIDLDAADLAVGVGIELIATLLRLSPTRLPALSTRPLVPADTEGCRRCRDFMSPVLATAAATKATVPLATIEQRGVLLAAVLIDIIIDRDPRVGGED